ncbi:MAG: hypothetical protein F4W90_12555 [Gammaproteobacteria bacterium]|nr:hypothetical protein [Gammaproteobacteria bacterium]
MENRARIGDVWVRGIEIDESSRCLHYRSSLDIVAIRHYCCGDWYACIHCHAQIAKHEAKVWPLARFDTHAVLCGGCGRTLSINEYLECASTCPHCQVSFNPGCSLHHHLYFEQSTRD